MEKRKDFVLLVALICALVILNYSFLDNAVKGFLSEARTVHIERVIDGDTVVTSSGEHIRLLGINAPETSSKEPYSEEAKNYLESLIGNKNVTLEFTHEHVDKYGRTLAYLYINRSNVNVAMVENGFANYYFYSGRDIHSDELENAWNMCLANKVNLCEPSKEACGSCIKLGSYYYIENLCSFSCSVQNWTIKGEGRDKIVLNGTLSTNQKKEFDSSSLDLVDSGGTVFLRDEKGGFVDDKVFN